MSIFSSKPQRFKAVIKDGKPTGAIRQTNKSTPVAKAKHAAAKKLSGGK